MNIPEGFVASPFIQLLGCRVVRLEEGLAEVAMGLACSTAHGFDNNSVTLECKINYIRAVSDGEVACIARVIHAGRRTLVVDAEVFQNDKLMAKAQATFAAL